MANVNGFQLLVDIRNNDDIKHGLLLPSVFRSKVPIDSTSCVLVDSDHREYEVGVSRGPDHQALLCSGEWELFVNFLLAVSAKKLCLKLVKVNTFDVMCFVDDGVEISLDENEDAVINRFIVEATYETFTKQLVPPFFFSKLDVPLNTERSGEAPPKSLPEKETIIIGCRQDGKVKVIYRWFEEKEKWEACGFEGARWTNICFENNVEAGYTLMFSRCKEVEYTLDVFNLANVGVGIAGEGTDDDEECELFADPDERNFTHECRVQHHKHKIN